MPITTDPARTYPVYLAIDATRPQKERPAFLFRYLTVRKADEIDAMIERAAASEDNKTSADLCNAILAAVMAGWAGFDLPFSLAALDDVVTWGEKWELVFTFRQAGRLAEADQKKSASPVQSAGVESAKDVPGDAMTRLQSTAPQESPAGDATVRLASAPAVEVSATMS